MSRTTLTVAINAATEVAICVVEAAMAVGIATDAADDIGCGTA